MVQVLIVYASDHGHTQQAAVAVAEGAESAPNASVRHCGADRVEPGDLSDADALILGTPVHMGSPHWEIKRFIDEVLGGLWVQDRLVGRVGGVFATGGGLGGAGGGCELAMLTMVSALVEMGMILTPLPKSTPSFQQGGLHWGPYVRCGSAAGRAIELPAPSLPLLRSHGLNVARVASLTAGQPARSAFGTSLSSTNGV